MLKWRIYQGVLVVIIFSATMLYPEAGTWQINKVRLYSVA